jgi:hypothetical protein
MMRTFRPLGISIVGFVAFFVLAALAVLIAVVLPAQNHFTLGQTATICILLGGFLFAVVLVARSKVQASSESIVVVNGWRTRRFGWAEVKLISMNDGAPWPTLVTVDDERIMLFGIQASDRNAARAALSYLLALFEASRS